MSENKDVLGISQDNQTDQDNSVKLPDVVAKHIADISEPLNSDMFNIWSK